MFRRAVTAAVAVVTLAVVPVLAVSADAATRRPASPGAPGIGDPYFPLDGNGGYDVKQYDLDIRYTPDTDVLAGTATITARAKQRLSQFNLDLDGLTVNSVRVEGRRASWQRSGGELTIKPRRSLDSGERFTTVIRYEGIPALYENPILGTAGFFHTDDGALVVGEPDVAASWFPVNDHPSDKASYRIAITVPEGLTGVSNGVLKSSRTRGGWTTWTWDQREPMASYLATATIGEFDLRAYQADGIKYWDAFDPDLFGSIATPRTGERFAFSQTADASYKRLTRTISVPAGGAQLSFWITRFTEPAWDYAFVEAHAPGSEEWTTLPDQNGHTSTDTGFSCPTWLSLHPFLSHYQGDNGDGTCAPTGTTGSWNAATGSSDGPEAWSVDLSDYAGTEVEVSISYASDEIIRAAGLFVDDVTVSTGEGTTSFEDDGDTFDGWTVPGAPAGSPGNDNDWIAGTSADGLNPVGPVVEQSFARQPEIIAFLSDNFGPYPFRAAGGIVDDTEGLGFALENQTRPIYAQEFFGDPISGESLIVHELAHQWFGDSLAVEEWQHIWLNEGFATYAEWLWSEREGLGTAQETFDFFYGAIPADDPFWQLTIGDPGPERLFDGAVYTRGAMTLHQLRLTVGDRTFFRILRKWAARYEGGNVTTAEFIRLAERQSGQDLDGLFDAWLFSPTKPDVAPRAMPLARTAASTALQPPAAASIATRLRMASHR